jgi:hypothetical protein
MSEASEGDSTTASQLERATAAGLNAAGHPALSVRLASDSLKGGYICETSRVEIRYAEGQDGPRTAIIKRVCEAGGDHEVALRLKLYDREWQFYESGLSAEVPLRTPAYLGSLCDEGGKTIGVILEDLQLPGAVLNPQLDQDGIILTARHMAKLHAKYWNHPKLASGELGIRKHDDEWFKPAWQHACEGYWPEFERKWRAREGSLP